MLSLLDHGYAVTIIDNLDNAYEEAYRRMQELAGSKASNMKFIKVRYSGTYAIATHLKLLSLLLPNYLLCFFVGK